MGASRNRCSIAAPVLAIAAFPVIGLSQPLLGRIGINELSTSGCACQTSMRGSYAEDPGLPYTECSCDKRTPGSIGSVARQNYFEMPT